MDPEAMKLPVGSNLAAKTSPEWPESSITGACNPLVRGACWWRKVRTLHSIKEKSPEKLTVWTKALLLPDALSLARAPADDPTFWRFTIICPALGSSEAGRFSADMVAIGLLRLSLCETVEKDQAWRRLNMETSCP